MEKSKTVREVLEKVYSCEVESDAKDKERILAQAEAEIKEELLGKIEKLRLSESTDMCYIFDVKQIIARG